MRRNPDLYDSEDSNFDFEDLQIQEPRVYRNVTKDQLKKFKISYKKSARIKTSQVFFPENGLLQEIRFEKQKMNDFSECEEIFKQPFILQPFESTKIVWNKFYNNEIKLFLDKIQVDETEEDVGNLHVSS